jgi:O-antigen/teichoic acid export membrane protein
LSVYKNILKHSSVYAIAVVFSRMLSILLLPVYTRYLTPADYGVLELLDLTTAAVSILIGVHISDAFLFFYSAAETQENRDRILSTAFLGAAGLAVVIVVPVCFLAPRLSEFVLQSSRYGFLFQLTFLNLVFVFPQEVATGYIRFQNRSGLLVKLQIVRLCLSLVVNVVLLAYFHLGVAAMLYGYLAGNIFVVSSAGYLALRGIQWTWDYREFGQLFRYALPIGFSGIAVMVVNFGDRFVLQRNVTVAEIGLYSLAYKMGMLVAQLQAIFFTYWASQMYVVLKERDSNRIFGRVTTYYTLVLAAGAMALSVFAYPIVRVLAAPGYIEAARFVPLVALAYLIKAWGDQVRTLVFVEKRPGLDMQITYVGAAVCLAGYLLLIPRFKLYGALAATLIAFTVMAIHSVLRVRRLRTLTIEWARLGTIAAAFSVAVALASLARQPNVFVRLAVGTGATIAFLGVLAAMKFFHAHEIDSLRQLLSALGRSDRNSVGAVR